MVSFPLRRPSQLDPFEHQRQLRRIDLDVPGAVCGAGYESERSSLEPLLHDTEAVSVPEQKLRNVTSSVEEHEQMSAHDLESQLALDHRGDCPLIVLDRDTLTDG